MPGSLERIHEIGRKWRHTNLLSIADLSPQDIVNLIDAAAQFKALPKSVLQKDPPLAGKTVCNLFIEASTRTRTSFTIAAKRLGADITDLSVNTSSMQKGENLKDTVKVIKAMGVDAIVVRHSSSGAAHYISRCFNGSVINAGDGHHEHPSQALLDLMTIKELVGKINGLNIAIVGDILHSRVARSNIIAMTKLGNNVTLVAPPTLLPTIPEHVATTHNLEKVLPKSDVVMLLRLQLERETGGYIPSVREFSHLFGLTEERLSLLKPGVVVMHPGPMNRGIEVSGGIADSVHSAVLRQVENGIYTRMAILSMLIGQKK